MAKPILIAYVDDSTTPESLQNLRQNLLNVTERNYCVIVMTHDTEIGFKILNKPTWSLVKWFSTIGTRLRLFGIKAKKSFL